jgi:hypothetical protein
MFFAVDIGGDSGGGSTSGSDVNLALFIERAQTASCADIYNRLYLIDGQLVFWDIKGNCADASYSQMLFGGSPDEVLCRFNDSIAGPMKSCEDESYQTMFETITIHADQPDLGLGEGHTVEPITF